MAYDKVVDSGVLDGKLTAIADAIRGKTGGADALTLEQMAAAIAGISGGGGGDDSLLASLADRSIVNFHSDEIINIYASRLCENCKSLVSVDLPNLKNFYESSSNSGAYAFSGCSALKTVNMEALENIHQMTFNNCTALENIVLPAFKKFVGQQNFAGCTNLKCVDLGNKTDVFDSHEGEFGQYQFKNCTNLSTLVLRAEIGVWELNYSNTFDGTPFASGGTGGTVYVPSALIESYQTATNWSTLYAAGTCNFVAIEGSEYE